MNRRAWHLISTGHRPKDGADVICIFHNGEAIECHYNKEFDVLKDKFFLYGKIQPVVIKLIGKDDFKRTFIF